MAQAATCRREHSAPGALRFANRGWFESVNVLQEHREGRVELRLAAVSHTGNLLRCQEISSKEIFIQ
jgi:hypothetical protein